MKFPKQNSTEAAGIKSIVHLLNPDYDMIIIALTLRGGKNKLA